ncbi:MAG TPA: hypothetical protein VJ249_03020 [Candidatus Bathyarchaeia archaeon]|nr:hypothetical protein [Candidatus Bathyarchaeia archaeon]
MVQVLIYGREQSQGAGLVAIVMCALGMVKGYRPVFSQFEALNVKLTNPLSGISFYCTSTLSATRICVDFE